MGRALKCVYCPEKATTNDHVIARCLLEKPYPPNLMTVPSCLACNAAYKADEEYLLAVMSQAGFVPSLMAKIEQGGVVDRMLQGSSGLEARITSSLRVSDDRRIHIIPDETRIANVALKVAFGLYCHRYTPQMAPTLDQFFALKPMHGHDPENFIVVLAHTERFQPRRWNHVKTIRPVGSRKIQVFDYMFVRNWYFRDFGRLFCVMRFHETIWAAVRCPDPSNRKHPRRRVGEAHLGTQGRLFR